MTSPLQQKLKISGPVVVTANRLGDGAVVYRAADGRWTTRTGAGASRHRGGGGGRTAGGGAMATNSPRSAPMSRRSNGEPTAA